MHSRHKLILSLLILSLSPPSLFAQIDRASLNGTVTDPSGAVIPPAKQPQAGTSSRTIPEPTVSSAISTPKP